MACLAAAHLHSSSNVANGSRSSREIVADRSVVAHAVEEDWAVATVVEVVQRHNSRCSGVSRGDRGEEMATTGRKSDERGGRDDLARRTAEVEDTEGASSSSPVQQSAQRGSTRERL